MAGMSGDAGFLREADAAMEQLCAQFAEFDPDEVEADLAMGVLTLEFADGSRCVMNRQSAAQQIWLAVGASAWHFARDPATGEWQDTKGRGSLREVLAAELGRKLGRPVKL